MSDTLREIDYLFGKFTPPPGWKPLVSLNKFKSVKVKPIIEGILNKNEYGLEAGVKNTDKTWFAAYMAVCVATGTPFFGRKVKKGKVVFAYGEGRVVDRLMMLLKGMGLRKPRNLFTYQFRADLSEKEAQIDLLRHIPPGTILVIIDNFEKFWASDMDDKAVAAAMQLMFQIREETSVILIHHEVKNQRKGANKHALSKGLTKIVNSADATFSLSKSKNGVVVVELYSREMDEPSPIRFKRVKVEPDGMLLDSIEQQNNEGQEPKSRMIEDAEKIYDFLLKQSASEAQIRAAMRSKFGMSRDRVSSAIYLLKSGELGGKHIRHNGLFGPASRWKAVKSC